MRTLTAIFVGTLLAAALDVAAQPAAEIVSVQGRGEFRPPQVQEWRPARVKQPLDAGQFVRTPTAESRMALLLADQTQLTLGGNSIAQVKGPDPAGARRSIVDFNKGTGRFQTKTPTKSFAVGTPTGLAAIRGTEWLVEVADDGRSAFTVVEGELEISNDLGSLSIGPDEQGILERGRAPYKQRLQNARARVQWVGGLQVDASRYPDAARPGADALLLQSEVALSLGEAVQALALLDQAARDFPGDARIAGLTVRAALFADDFPRARAAAETGLAKFPGAVETQLHGGELARLDGQFFLAEARLREATRLAPGDWRTWHALGRLYGERGDPHSARRALAEALAKAPGNATVMGELALVEAQAPRLARARELFGRALDAQPDDFTAWTGLGLERLRAGDPDAALPALLRATLLEPRHAKAHAYLAVAYWQLGRRDDALAALRTASVHDPRDPLPYQLTAMMLSDLLRPGDALAAARDSVARLAFTRSLDPIANDLRGSANLGAPLAQLGLEAWALKNAQDSFDPLWAGSHLFLADRLPGKFVANSELLQGFLTDPAVFGSSNRFQSLLPRPGHYGTLAVRAARSSDATLVEPLLNANGAVADGRGAYFFEGARARNWADGGGAAERATSGTAGLGWRDESFGAFLYFNRLLPDIRSGFDDNALPQARQRIDGSAQRVDGGFYFRRGPDWQLWLKGGEGREESQLTSRETAVGNGVTVFRDSDFSTQPRRRDLQARGTWRMPQGPELWLGLESARANAVDFLERDFAPRMAEGTPRLLESVRQDIRDESKSYFVGGRWRSSWLEIEAQVDRMSYDKVNDILVRRDFAGQRVALADNHAREETSLRAGAVLRPVAGLTLRVASQEWMRPASLASLQPSSTAGIVLDDGYVLAGGTLDRRRVQVEWAAHRNVLVTAFAERQRVDNLYSDLIGVLNNRPDTSNLERLRNRSFNSLASLDALEGFPTLSRGEQRASGLAINALVTRQASLFAEYRHAKSENTGTRSPGAQWALLPKQRYAIGGTWFSDHRWSVAAKAIRRGERYADEGNMVRLAAEWDGAVQLYWETVDKHWSVELIVVNIGARSADESVGLAINYRF